MVDPRFMYSLSLLPWRGLRQISSSWNPLVSAIGAMLLGVTGGREVSLPVAVVAEAEGCGAVISGFVEKF